jgi:hypothetical protein
LCFDNQLASSKRIFTFSLQFPNPLIKGGVAPSL